MAGRGTGKGTLVGSFTRTVFVVGVCLTFGTGVGLFAVPGGRRTIGLGRSRHRSRLRSSVLATWEPRWLCSLLQGPGNGAARAVLAFTLTSLALLDTLRNLRPFAFGEGGLIEAVTWIWLAVYVALPPLLLVAFVLAAVRLRHTFVGGGLHRRLPRWPRCPAACDRRGRCCRGAAASQRQSGDRRSRVTR